MHRATRLVAIGWLLAAVVGAWQSGSVAQPSIRLDCVPDRLVFPVPEGANVVVTATLRDVQVRSVWLAREKDSIARLMLTPVAEGEYQINLSEPVIAAVLGVEARSGQFRAFAETTDGQLLQSIALRYRFRDALNELAGFYVRIEGELVHLAPLGRRGEFAYWNSLLAAGSGRFPSSIHWFDDGEVEAVVFRPEEPVAVTSAFAACGERKWPFAATAQPGVFELEITPDTAQAWREHVTIAVHHGVIDPDTLVLGIRPSRLDLPDDYAAFTVYQRRCEPVPGSGSFLRLCLQDITAGQVVVEILTAEGDVLMAPTSVRVGDEAGFALGEHSYVLAVERLVNVLVGRDFGLFAVSQSGRSERKRILRLIECVESSNIGFIREGRACTGAEAAQHLRFKLEHAAPQVKTLDDFIAKVASRSSTTGEPYQVQLSDGTTVEAEAWLLEKKAELFGSGEPADEAQSPTGAQE